MKKRNIFLSIVCLTVLLLTMITGWALSSPKLRNDEIRKTVTNEEAHDVYGINNVELSLSSCDCQSGYVRIVKNINYRISKAKIPLFYKKEMLNSTNWRVFK